jgi:drug/metabolite transporter (DMT)-like permease
VKTAIGAGILLTSLAYFLFSVHDGMIKLLVETTTVWQILFCRSLTILFGCFAMGGKGLFRETTASPVIKPLLIRSFILLAAWLCYFNAAKYLPLADITTLYFAAPVVVILLAIPMLGEHVTWPRWLAVGIGFLGVVIATNPTGMSIEWPVYLALLAACLWAFATVLLRRTAMGARTPVQMVVTNFFFLLLTAPMTINSWVSPDGTGSLLLLAVGIIGGIGQLAFFEGMRRAPISVIAPFEYTALVWAFILGYAIWGDIPGYNVILGALLIASAGIIIILGERQSMRA